MLYYNYIKKTSNMKNIPTDNIGEILQDIKLEVKSASDFVLSEDEVDKVYDIVANGNEAPLKAQNGLSRNAMTTIEPFTKEVEKIASLSLEALEYKLVDRESVDKASINDLSSTVDRMIKLRQLLTGGLTSNVGVMASDIQKRIIEHQDGLYD
jgi:hypothetical protein